MFDYWVLKLEIALRDERGGSTLNECPHFHCYLHHNANGVFPTSSEGVNIPVYLPSWAQRDRTARTSVHSISQAYVLLLIHVPGAAAAT